MLQNFVAVDGGQTGIKLRARIGSRTAELRQPGVQTHRPLLPQLAAAVAEVSASHGTSFEVVAVGTTGLTKAEHDAAALQRLLPATQPPTVLLAHDSVSSYLGALGDRRGAVVAAGTGVVTLAVGARNVARVDGWGNIMGDAGSAYWMGQQVLSAVMRAFDGRGPVTQLAETVLSRWPDLEEAYINLQSLPDRIAVVASFGKETSKLAETDQVAARICDQAGWELARSVAAALRRTGLLERPGAPVACLGGVFAGAQVRSAFALHLGELAPHARLVEPEGNGLDGITRMAELPEDHPLRSLISRA